jgi:DNA polymerase-3 subunit alpha
MAAEKDAFGFYFSAHPVDRYRHIADARGAKSYGALCSASGNDSGGRSGAVMAAMVEDVRWRDTRRGGRYVSATFSDSSGQFQASCFDEAGCKAIEALGQDGECALLTVELERQPGEDTPRVTVRSVQPFAAVANSMRMELWIDVEDPAALTRIAGLLAGCRGGRSEIRVRALVDGGVARVRLGRDYNIEADLVERITAVPGVVACQFAPREPLRLVG